LVHCHEETALQLLHHAVRLSADAPHTMGIVSATVVTDKQTQVRNKRRKGRLKIAINNINWVSSMIDNT